MVSGHYLDVGTIAYDSRSDADLVVAARIGDKDAFASLVDRHNPMVSKLVARYMGSAAAAADAAQEAAVAALVGLERLRAPESFGPWYAGIALNIARGWLRGAVNSVPLSGEWEDGRPGPDEMAEATELAERVRQAVEGLAPGQRQAVLAFYWLGLTHAEAAIELDISPGALKARLHQARAALLPQLAPHVIVDKEVHSMPSTIEPRWVTVDVAEIRRSVSDDSSRRLHVVVLQEREGGRHLPIYVGAPEATALACTLEAVEVPRPMTYQMAANLIEAAGARVIDARITRLAESTFYAVVRIEGSAGEVEVDARPSDALNLALVCGAPILVDAVIFDHEGPFRHPEWRTAWQKFPTGAPDIAAEVRDRQAQFMQMLLGDAGPADRTERSA